MLDIKQVVPGIQLEGILGKGGNATVYKGVYRLDGSVVAVKILHSQDTNTYDNRTLEFFNELHAVASLNHDRITTVFDYGVHDDQDSKEQSVYWLAMEYVEGGTLRDVRKGLRWETLEAIIVDILEGLAHAHARRLIHRDIKPQNILYDAPTQKIKIADFGLGKSLQIDEGQTLEEEMHIQGTPQYMAPEQISRDVLSLGPWTDLYAVGCVVWEMVCGSPPFKGDHETLFQKHLNQPLPNFEPLFDVPVQLGWWLQCLMAKSPDERYQNAPQALHALQHLEDCIQPGHGNVHLFEEDLDAPTEAVTSIFNPSEVEFSQSEEHSFPWSVASKDVVGYRSGKVKLCLSENWDSTNTSNTLLVGAGLNLLKIRTLEVVGRRRERGLLWKQCSRVVQHEEALAIMIEGASGTGKQALSKWLAHRGEELGALKWMEANFDDSVDYQTSVLNILCRYFRLYSSNVSILRPRLTQIHSDLLMEYPEDIEDLLTLLLQRESHKGSLWKPEQFNALINRYLIAIAKQCPILVILQKVDHAAEVYTWVSDFLDAHPNVPILFLLTQEPVDHREDEPVDPSSALFRHPSSSMMRLESMSSVDLIQFIQNLVGLTPESASFVEAKSGGNPQVAVQMIIDWIDKGLLVTTKTGFELRSGVEATLPSDMMDVWRNRWIGLKKDWSTKQMAIIEVASVIGLTVDSAELQTCLQVLGHTYDLTILQPLFKLGWILPSDNRKGWRFSTPVFREIILQYLKEQCRLSQIASGVLHALSTKTTSIQRRAEWYVHAGEPYAALSPLFEACLKEVMGFEIGAGRRLNRRRDSILAQVEIDPLGKHAFETEMLTVLLASSEEQIDYISTKGSELIDWAKRLNDWRNVARLYSTFGRKYWQNGSIEQAHRYLHKALRYARKYRFPLEVSILHKLIFLTEDNEKAYAYCREALYLSEELGSIEKIGLSYNSLGIILSRSRDLLGAEYAFNEAKLRFERSNFRPGLIDLWLRTGEMYRKNKDFIKAKKSYRQGLKLNQMIMPVSLNVILCQVNLIIVHFEANERQEVIEYAEKIWEVTHPKLHSKLPRIGAVISGLTRLLSLSIRSCWLEMLEVSQKLRETMTEIHLFDEDVYWFLEESRGLAEQNGQAEIVTSIWVIIHEQYTRQGRTKEADSIRPYLPV